LVVLLFSVLKSKGFKENLQWFLAPFSINYKHGRSFSLWFGNTLLSLYKSTKFSMTRQELLDEEFESLRRIALAICQNLGRPKDREICRSTLEELARLHQAPSIRIKENVHKFMMFYLKVLRWTQKNQPVDLYRQWVSLLMHIYY